VFKLFINIFVQYYTSHKTQSCYDYTLQYRTVDSRHITHNAVFLSSYFSKRVGT